MELTNAESYLEGQVLFIDKPLTWTSFDVVNKIRKSLRQALGIKKIKVGHAGTLDPLATGLVIICTGRATKQIMQFQHMDKAYDAKIRLGATTPSYDLETEVDKEYPWKNISLPMLEDAMEKLSGDQEQLPPIFSAKSVDGERAYVAARKGKEVALKKQSVHIAKMELLDFNPPNLSIHVECSKGTYIRAIARDLGTMLDSGGHLTGLRRTRIGPYDVKDATSMEKFLENLKLL